MRYFGSSVATMGFGFVSGGVSEWARPTSHPWWVYGILLLSVALVIAVRSEWPGKNDEA